MIGYCCINKTLRKDKVYTNRTLIRRTFTMEKASELALQNCLDLLSILHWNKENDINVFRVSSCLFPRMTDEVNGYDLDDLSTANDIKEALRLCGEFANDNNMILSCHPGPFTVLSSSNPNVVDNAIKEVEMHRLIGELLDVDFNINFHIGRGFSKEAADLFCEGYNRLSDAAKSMVVVENDDKANGWSVSKLYNHIYSQTGIPITYDWHHSKFSREQELDEEFEFQLAKSTWKDIMEVHISQSADDTRLVRAHSGYIDIEFPEYLLDDTYVLFEAKEKELSVLRYMQKQEAIT
jgi:UV DNA damage endonuclease